ncbi:hypothetical protein [Nocardia sp. X0981]
MDTEALPPAERRNTVRRLIALCHIADELVDLADTGPDTGAVTPALRENAIRLRAVLRDMVVDLVANGRANHPDMA